MGKKYNPLGSSQGVCEGDRAFAPHAMPSGLDLCPSAFSSMPVDIFEIFEKAELLQSVQSFHIRKEFELVVWDLLSSKLLQSRRFSIQRLVNSIEIPAHFGRCFRTSNHYRTQALFVDRIHRPDKTV